MSRAQTALFIDKNVHSVINEYVKYSRNDTIIHLTIDKNKEGIIYTVVGADTQEAASKYKIQGVFRDRYLYILLESNLKNGVALDLKKQPQYKAWITNYLKPQTIEFDFPDSTDTTLIISEMRTRHYQPPTLVIRYKNGKFYNKNIFYD